MYSCQQVCRLKTAGKIDISVGCVDKTIMKILSESENFAMQSCFLNLSPRNFTTKKSKKPKGKKVYTTMKFC